MASEKCGRCGATHGPFESCYMHPAKYYYFSSEWLSAHPNEGGKWEICWVIPLASKPSWDIPNHDAALLTSYFTHVWDSRHTGGSETPPCKSRTNRVVVSCGKPLWTIVYRWAPEILVDAKKLEPWLLEQRRKTLGHV